MTRPKMSVAAVLALAVTMACGGSAPLLVSPSSAAPGPFAVSVQSVVLGSGVAGVYGEGITLSIWAGRAATVSARLEMGFADGSAVVEVPFNPGSVRVGPDARVMLSASIPDASDPRLAGRKPSSFRAGVTVRDDAGAEQTVFTTISVTQR